MAIDARTKMIFDLEDEIKSRLESLELGALADVSSGFKDGFYAFQALENIYRDYGYTFALLDNYENLKKWLNLKYTAKTILLSRSPMDSIDEILDKAEEHIRRIKEGEY